MSNRPLQLAKREVQATVSSRRAWIALVAAGLLLGLSGPFGTEEAMPFLPRTAYWLAVAVSTFLLGTWVNTAVANALGVLGYWSARVLAACVNGLAVAGLILALNFLLFGITFAEGDLRALAAFVGTVVAVSLVISLAYAAVEHSAPDTPATEPVAEPRLLRRLPLEKRGALISISVADHYVEVTTTGGTELLLMRLSDAIDETDPVPGLRVHRSHWVAVSAVVQARRLDGKGELRLSDGRALPVSRSNLPKVKEAGLLPG